VTSFAHKTFEKKTYTFEHLVPMELAVHVKAKAIEYVPLHVTFGCHCFTEEFEGAIHQDHHRYVHAGELRAFDTTRYACSLQLPHVMSRMLTGRVYLADSSYTYVAQIPLAGVAGMQNYSVFFNLEKDKRVPGLALRMFVKSAYLRDLASPKNAQSWRFAALAGETSGAFALKSPEDLEKKKGPKALPLTQ